MQAEISHTDFPDARLAALREKLSALSDGPAGLSAYDIECEPDGNCSVYHHSPAVSIAFDKTNHAVMVESRFVAASSLPPGMVRWRTDLEEDRDRAAFEKAEGKRLRKANKQRKLTERDEAKEASKPLQTRFEVAAKSNDWTGFTAAELGLMQTAGMIKQVKQEIEIVHAKPIAQATVNFLNRLAEQNDRVRDIVLNGFHFPGGVVADRPYGEVHEFFGVGKYRSSQHPSLAKLVKALARASSGRSQSGRNKREVIAHGKSESNLEIRFAPYIVADPRRLGVLVAELDSTWLSYNDLIMALRGALPRKLMPAMVVSRKSWCGKYEVEKPHLLWVLPCPVGRNGKSRLAPERFFRRVQRAIINALIPLGADPGHLNTGKFKNPLSPFWNVLCLNGAWPSLEDFRGRGGINLSTNEAAMKQKAMLYRSTKPGESVSLSNEVWVAGKEMIEAGQAAAHAMQDPDYLQSRKDENHRRRWLRSLITGPMIARFGGTDQVHRVIDQHVDWWAKHRDSANVDFGRDAARILAEEQNLGRTLTEKERQKLAEEETHNRQRTESLHAVAGAVLKALQAGYEPAPKNVVMICKGAKSASKSTVYKYWDEAVLLAQQSFRAAIRYIATPNPAITIDPDLPSSHPVDTSQDPVQPSGPSESGNIERPQASFWPLPAPCGPPVSTEGIDFDFGDATAIPATAEACIRPQAATLH